MGKTGVMRQGGGHHLLLPVGGRSAWDPRFPTFLPVPGVRSPPPCSKPCTRFVHTAAHADGRPLALHREAQLDMGPHDTDTPAPLPALSPNQGCHTHTIHTSPAPHRGWVPKEAATETSDGNTLTPAHICTCPHMFTLTNACLCLHTNRHQLTLADLLVCTHIHAHTPAHIHTCSVTCSCLHILAHPYRSACMHTCLRSLAHLHKLTPTYPCPH